MPNLINMKHSLLIILLFASISLFAQTLCRTDIMNGEKITPKNQLTAFGKYNFSNLWLHTANSSIYGIIGDDNQRILIKILSVAKSKNDAFEYLVSGKSSVKGSICDFSGKIIIQKIQLSERINFGVDDEYKSLSKTQGLLTAKYELFENKDQKHSGVFEGELKTKWYLNKKDQVKYDDINAHSDGYFNNAFVGYWKMYNATLRKKCNWADFRVPNVACDFDIGTADFNVAEKYWNKGWLDIAVKNIAKNEAIIEAKAGKTKNEWWQ
jgi:hypothetical protein